MKKLLIIGFLFFNLNSCGSYFMGLCCQQAINKTNVDENVLNAAQELEIDNLKFVDDSLILPGQKIDDNIKFVLSGTLDANHNNFLLGNSCYKGFVEINFIYKDYPTNKHDLDLKQDFSNYKINNIWIKSKELFFEVDMKQVQIKQEYNSVKYYFFNGPQINPENDYLNKNYPVKEVIIKFTKDNKDKSYFLKSYLNIDFGQYRPT